MLAQQHAYRRCSHALKLAASLTVFRPLELIRRPWRGADGVDASVPQGPSLQRKAPPYYEPEAAQGVRQLWEERLAQRTRMHVRAQVRVHVRRVRD